MACLHGHFSGLAENLVVAQRTKVNEDQEHSQNKPGIPDPVYDKSLFPGISRALLLQVVTDEQIGAQAHAFPSHKHQDKIVRQNQREHGEHEKIEVGKETVVAGVVPHIPRRIYVDQKSYARDHQDHHRRERIQQKPPRHREPCKAALRYR